MLYTFQAVSPPIIRNTKLYTQHPVYVKLACYYRYPKAIVRPKELRQ